MMNGTHYEHPAAQYEALKVDQETVPVKKDAQQIEYAIALVTHWRNILNARLLALISLIGALGVFGVTVYDPSVLKLWSAGLYAVSVLIPTIALYMKKG